MDNKPMLAAGAYIGPLVIVSYILGKDDTFIKYHIKQGLVLFVIEVAIWFLSMVAWPLWLLLNILNLAVLVLVILGIVNVVQGKEKELPIVGQFSSYFKI